MMWAPLQGRASIIVIRYTIVRFKCSQTSVATAPSPKTNFRNYDPYWPRTFVNRMLNADLLVEGRLCYTSPNSAYVINPSDGNRIFIYCKSLNRALPNDIVAVKLNTVDHWRVHAFLGESETQLQKAVTPPIIPAEAEEEEEEEDDGDSNTDAVEPRPDVPPTTINHFQLTIDNSCGFPPTPRFYPSVRDVLEKSPQLFHQLFPNSPPSTSSGTEGSLLSPEMRDQKPLNALPSPHLLRTGRVVGILGEDSASRRLVGRLVFESASMLPSAFAEAEQTDEYLRPTPGVLSRKSGGGGGGSGGKAVDAGTVSPNVACFFVPEKPHAPRVKVAPSSVPEDLWRNPHKAEGVRYICEIHDWSNTSACPKGVLCDQLGNPQDIEPATQEILIAHGISETGFSPQMLSDLPAAEAEFRIPHYEYLRRRDFRAYCVFSVDPSTAKDLDDALHVLRVAEDVYEVGVHIADVSFFVRPSTALDQEAANRTTSTYLVQRVIPMLPSILSEHLCSLNPGVDRLSFSVVFRINSEGEILDEWFGRSIIRSCARLSYEDTTAVLATPSDRLAADLSSRMPVHAPFSLEPIKRSIGYLDMLAQKMRKGRIDSGALLLDKVELQFDLNPQSQTDQKEGLSGWPRGYHLKQRGRAHHLIEEWMLAANQAVARRLFHEATETKKNTTDLEGCGGEKRRHYRSSVGTILRRHPAPRSVKMVELVQLTKSAAISMDASSAGSIRASLDAYTRSLREKNIPEDEIDSLSTALSYLTYMRMQMALYFNVEDIVDRALRGLSRSVSPSDSASSPENPSWESSLTAFSHHFGLNVPLYTHFTSPIRRYADLLVHRQLADLLDTGHWSCPQAGAGARTAGGGVPPRRLTVQAAWCNRMRRETRRAQEESQQLFLAAWIKSCGGINENAVVLGFGGGRIQLLVPSCGLVLTHPMQKFFRDAHKWTINSKGAAEIDETSGIAKKAFIEVQWRSEQRHENGDAVPPSRLSILSLCPVKLLCSSRGLFIKAEIRHPFPAEM